MKKEYLEIKNWNLPALWTQNNPFWGSYHIFKKERQY